jgi:fructuronate reductase
VHLGVGAFHRAHQAVITEDAQRATGDTRWGITGVTQRSRTVVDQLAPQDGLFTVSERGEGAAPLRVITTLHAVVAGHEKPDDVVALIAAESTSVVTMTITEKGYRADPRSGRLNLTDDAVARDLTHATAHTAVGQIARGLQQRHRNDTGPINILSCDNLPANGTLTRGLVIDFVQALPATESDPLLAWIDENVAFPDSMVDRMVPATTTKDIDAVDKKLTLRDEGAVVAEPFLQWVIEDHFTADRPAWEQAGAFLTSDVAGWETAKLRLLNASHSLLAYTGLATGKTTIAEAITDETLYEACSRMMHEDVLPTLHLPEGLDGTRYAASVLQRFANPSLGHTTLKVGSDGSHKLGPRLLGTIQDSLRTGHTPRWAALAVAAWMYRVATTPAEQLDDPRAAALRAALPTSDSPYRVVDALLHKSGLFAPEVSANPLFRSLLTDWYSTLDEHGLEGLRKDIQRG